MVEYVYALHDFQPENEDEIPFLAGDRIEVVERDDLYGDGWWQGRNLAGKVGLFPQAYTAPAPASVNPAVSSSSTNSEATVSPPPDGLQSKPSLQPLDEESDSETQPAASSSSPPNNIHAPVPKAPTATFLTTDGTTDAAAESEADYDSPIADGDGVMRATMTDVQKAIEQLGRREGDARSFSFASTRDGGETSETDFDLSDLGDADAEGEDEDGGAYHKNMRKKLAERARKAVEDAERLEAMIGGRQTFPPIDVEVSDESDEEDAGADWTRSSGFRRPEPQILEEDEDGVSVSASETASDGKKAINGAGTSPHGKEASGATAATVVPGDLSAPAGTITGEEKDLLIPKKDEDDLATATRSDFPPIQSPPLPFADASGISSPSSGVAHPEISSVFRAQSPAKEEVKPSPASRTQSPVRAQSPARAMSPVRAMSPQVQARAQSPAVRAQSPAALAQSPARAQSPLRPTSPQVRTDSPPPTGRRSPARASLPTPISPVMELRNERTTPVSAAHVQQQQAEEVQVQSQQAQPEIKPVNVAFPSPEDFPTPPSTMPQSVTSTLVNDGHEKGKEKKHPSEWNVDDVVDWLRSRGFDQDVCDKFIEQEITGDVLLELDANVLKSEIGILAFGKRVRIANAISDLRRPPSVGYSDNIGESSPGYGSFPPISPNSQSGFSQGSQPHPGRGPPYIPGAAQLFPQASQLFTPPAGLPYSGPTPTQAYAASGYGSQTHSRTQSQSQSHHSSFVAGHSYSQSLQSSLGSPIGNGGNYFPSSDIQQVAESPVPTEMPAPLVSQEKEAEKEKEDGKSKGRPAHLTLSPSEGALKAKARAVSDVQAKDEEERGHMSESEVMPSASVRRRLFGRSHDSSQSVPSRRTSGEGSFAMPSPTTKEIPDKEKTGDKEKEKEKDKEKDATSVRSRHSRGRKSIDAGKGSTRLSFFGDIGGSLGKGRKPAPRFSDDGTPEKHSSMFSLPKLSHGSSIRKVSGMSRTSVGSDEMKETKESKKEAKKEEERAKKDAERTRKEEKVKERTEKEDREKEKEREKERERAAKDPALLRKRVSSTPQPPSNGTLMVVPGVKTGIVTSGKSILEQIGEPDHAGWMRKKGERYNSWKNRYFVLKGSHMYWLRSNSKTETKIKGYIHIVGYKVTVDENLDPGRYGFRIDHDNDKSHFFSSDEKASVREWMKAIMKATIGRDYTKPVVSSCNIPTIPLVVAQTMNPAPRPPSPTARAATQKSFRRENPGQLSSRDAQVLMALSNGNGERSPMFGQEMEVPATTPTVPTPKAAAPPRPSREMRRMSVKTTVSTVEEALIDWANSRLPESLQITDPSDPLCGGLALLRLAEAVKGKPASPPVPDSAFPTNPNDEKLDGLFRLFDFLLDNEVKIGSISINEIRQGKREKIIQLIRALKAWEDRRRAITQNIGDSAVQAGSFMAPISHGRI